MQRFQQLQNKNKNLQQKTSQRVCSWRKLFFGEKCEYLHKENDTSHDQIKTKERVDKLEQVVKDNVSEEN